MRVEKKSLGFIVIVITIIIVILIVIMIVIIVVRIAIVIMIIVGLKVLVWHFLAFRVAQLKGYQGLKAYHPPM